MKKALFLDLDHTVIRPKSGETFPKDTEDWEWMPGILDALRAEIEAAAGWQNAKIILVTNQGGVAAGYHTELDIEAKLRNIRRELGEAIGCPVHSFVSYKNDYYRKPSPGMAYKAALEFELDLSESTMVGDMDSDRVFAIAAGIGRYVDIKKYLPSPQLPPPVPAPGICAGRDFTQCVRPHCDCYHEAGAPIVDISKGLAPVAYRRKQSVFTPSRIDVNPIG